MVKKIASKLLTAWVYILNPQIPSQQRWFIRFRYLGRLRQYRYFIKDYIIKKPYKIISYDGEFQQELLHAIPHAYWHHKNGTLLKTISSEFSKHLYFFSPDHYEDPDIKRRQEGNFNLEIPNAPHDRRLLKLKWHSVPFKKHFKNDYFKFEKTPLLIANRFNTEWDKDPISYFSLEDLKNIINVLSNDFQIIYNRPLHSHISNDNSEILELNDLEYLKSNFPDVLIMTEMFRELNISDSYNHFQILLYSQVENFISIHGGTATLASMFGGVNFIFSKEGHEHALNEFENVFPELSGAKIKAHKTFDSLLTDLKKYYKIEI